MRTQAARNIAPASTESTISYDGPTKRMKGLPHPLIRSVSADSQSAPFRHCSSRPPLLERDPILTAEAFGVEEIIDPRDTRPLLVEFARRAYEIVAAEARGPKTRGMRP
jgi:hypothetical protein